MGLFRNRQRRDSGEFTWPFKPVDPVTGRHPTSAAKSKKRHSLKISNPILIDTTKKIDDYAEVPKTAPPDTVHFDNVVQFSQHVEPLFQESFLTPVDEKPPSEVSAASAARFHDYLEEIVSANVTPYDSSYEDNDDYFEQAMIGETATLISLAHPGKPRLVDISSASSFSSGRSANSSSDDVRLSGFPHSRNASEATNCSTPYTPASFFDSSEDSTPSEELNSGFEYSDSSPGSEKWDTLGISNPYETQPSVT